MIDARDVGYHLEFLDRQKGVVVNSDCRVDDARAAETDDLTLPPSEDFPILHWLWLLLDLCCEEPISLADLVRSDDLVLILHRCWMVWIGTHLAQELNLVGPLKISDGVAPSFIAARVRLLRDALLLNRKAILALLFWT